MKRSTVDLKESDTGKVVRLAPITQGRLGAIGMHYALPFSYVNFAFALTFTMVRLALFQRIYIAT